MDNDEFIQELKDFISKPVYNWLRNEYNRRVIKKMEDLHKVCIADTEQVIRIKSGELSGFKNGFELIETLINESNRKESDSNGVSGK